MKISSEHKEDITIYKDTQTLILSSKHNENPKIMTRHRCILGHPAQNPVRRTPFMMALRRAEEYSISDVRRFLRAQPDQITTRECREICKNARLRYLTKNPLLTLQSYKTELQIYLDYGNPEAHYIEGIKHYFRFYNARRGLKHLKISATNNFEHLDLLPPLIKYFGHFFFVYYICDKKKF